MPRSSPEAPAAHLRKIPPRRDFSCHAMPCPLWQKLLPSPAGKPIRGNHNDRPPKPPRHPAQPTTRTPSQTPPRASASVGVFCFHPLPRISHDHPTGHLPLYLLRLLGRGSFPARHRLGGWCTNAANPARHGATTSLRRLSFWGAFLPGYLSPVQMNAG